MPAHVYAGAAEAYLFLQRRKHVTSETAKQDAVTQTTTNGVPVHEDQAVPTDMHMKDDATVTTTNGVPAHRDRIVLNDITNGVPGVPVDRDDIVDYDPTTTAKGYGCDECKQPDCYTMRELRCKM